MKDSLEKANTEQRVFSNSDTRRMVRVKSWDELAECGRPIRRANRKETDIHPPKKNDTTVCLFIHDMRELCSKVVEIDGDGVELKTGDGWDLSPWMYEELEAPDPRVDERLQHNEEHQRKKAEPRLGPCLSCGEIKVLDMEGVMGECKDCICSRKSFETDVTKVLENIKEILLEKNRKYGDSALNPSRIFAKSDAVEQINVRIDDKLQRIQNRQDDEDEDVTTDLMGYLVLLKIAKRKGGDA
jgi:hypothetical protein